MPYRNIEQGSDSRIEILLITSRESGRWVIPKGNIHFTRSPHSSAATEALEEAGVRGKIGKKPLGRYRYEKRIDSGRRVTAKVDVFPLAVSEELEQWKERHERLRCWFPVEEAAEAVDEAGLRKLIRGLGQARAGKD